jgi:hypothetical protein
MLSIVLKPYIALSRVATRPRAASKVAPIGPTGRDATSYFDDSAD